MQTIGVIGAGAWGTALAQTAASNGRDVILWALEHEVAEAINTRRENVLYLPGVKLNEQIQAVTDLGAFKHCDAALLVTPAQHARMVLKNLNAYSPTEFPIVLCAKGFERGSLALMTDVLYQTIPQACPAVLSGPSFAIDVAKGLPTAVTLACENESVGQSLMQAIGSNSFRPYLSTDLIGAEIGGSVKNVLAIAAGIVEGRGLGKSAHSALIARGFAEMIRLGEALGAKRDTLSGLCGLGDLVLTCSSPQSRNMSCGIALGQGQSLDHILMQRHSVTEGIQTAPALVALAKNHNVVMPISEAVNAIIEGTLGIEAAINALLARPFTTEN